jgi:hypothetical protein
MIAEVSRQATGWTREQASAVIPEIMQRYIAHSKSPSRQTLPRSYNVDTIEPKQNGWICTTMSKKSGQTWPEF